MKEQNQIEKNLGQNPAVQKDYEAKSLPELKSNKALVIGIVVLVLFVIVGGIYWWLQKNNFDNKLPDSLVQLIKDEPVEPQWLAYVSDDQYFKINYPDNWKILDDKNIYFGIALYNDAQEPEAIIKIKKIEAKNKIELQEVLNSERQDCLKVEEENNCPLPVDIEKLTRIKISGETARIDTESEYLSGTTIYIYAKDYYLAVYEEYNSYDLLPTFEKIVDSIYIDIEQKYKHFYCNKESGQVSSMWGYNAYCHIVEPGETLWSIAENYYGDPYLWEQLKLYDNNKEFDLSRLSPDDPRALPVGTGLVLWNALQFSYDDRTAGGISDGWGLDTDTGDLYTTGAQKIYVNNEIYDGPFGWVSRFFVDERTNNKVYIVSPPGSPGKIFQFVVNKERNPYLGGGYGFELLTFNHNEDLYAVRTNVRQDVPEPGFIVLSNIGNGPEYDYLDSLIWYDNDTLVYRAQNDNQWRVVINHVDYEVYDYLENLSLEAGILKFDARHDDGSWTQEELNLNGDEYDALQSSFPEANNSKLEQEAFLRALRNSRSDLSEEQILEIEQRRHHKTVTLVDDFGKEITALVEVYLDPVGDTGISEEVGRLTFKTNDGKFKFVDGKLDLFVDELGAYTLSLQEGWSADSLKEINPIDFRYKEDDFKILVKNEEYNKEIRQRYIQIVEAGDTLWSLAERYYEHGYYWPLIVENNDLGSDDVMFTISEGDEIYMPPLLNFSIEKLDKLRREFHEKNVEEIFTINNEDFSYSIDYPECWEIGSVKNKEYNEDDPYYDTDIHEQWIIGPEYPNLPGKGRKPWLIIKVYDNREGMSVEEFAVSTHITDQGFVDDGTFIVKEREEGGGIWVEFYGDLKHLLFFKGGLIYDIAYVSHHSVDATSKQEMLDMVDSFKFVN